MLLNIHVKNLALIEEIEVDFFDHLNILTGETGAGKSILIGSIEAALGGKVAKDLIRQDKDYALVELTFSVDDEVTKKYLSEKDVTLDDNQIIISRKIMPNRSVCRINGETVNMGELRDIASYLIDLCSQQENVTLRSKSKQLNLLDTYAGDEAAKLLSECKEEYREYNKLKEEYDEIVANKEARLREVDFLKYGVDEIREANLKVGEDVELEKQYKRQAHAREIIESMGTVSNLISGDANVNIQSLISECIHAMSGISDIDETTKSLYDEINEIDSLVSDFSREMSSYVEDMSFDDINFKELEDRVNVINHLKSKYGNDIEMILKYADSKEAELEKMGDIEGYIKELESKLETSKKDLESTAKLLSKIRKKAAVKMGEEIKQALIELNFLQGKKHMSV
ncbi:MAG: AAA family ATPase [Lachnospiraceae bacterium]|nr:AAA family ATPase [Lachnospiraceae bacterium]